MQKVIFISKVPISEFPRLMSIPYALSDLDIEVIIVAPEELPEILSNQKNISFQKLHFKKEKDNILGKLLTWIKFRKEVLENLKKYSPNDIIWLSSADTAIPLIGRIRRFNFILQLNELYDELFFYRYFLKKLSINASSIVVPEYNRANIFRVWFNLKKSPFILPNKSIIPDNDNAYPEEFRSVITKINDLKSEGFKIMIYQGHIGGDRDFIDLVKILNELPFKTHLLLVGSDHGMVDKYKNIFKEITWVPNVKAPAHLTFTRIADIGIVFYNTSSLNNIFCAPNKTWEYAKYGLPILSNDIPGMIEATTLYKAGISCSFKLKSELKKAISTILYNYSEYSDNSKRMYNAVDYKTIINNII